MSPHAVALIEDKKARIESLEYYNSSDRAALKTLPEKIAERDRAIVALKSEIIALALDGVSRPAF